MAKSTRQDVLKRVKDLVGALMYYDRKEDETLPRGSIEKLVEKGEICAQEIIDEFSTELRKCIV